MPKTSRRPTKARQYGVVTTVRLPKETHDALRRSAMAESRTLAGQIRFILRGVLLPSLPIVERAK